MWIVKIQIILRTPMHKQIRRNVRNVLSNMRAQKKTQIRLQFCAVWSVYVVRMKKLHIWLSKKAPSKDSDQTAHSQADLKLLGVHVRSYVSFRFGFRSITKTRLFKYIENSTSKNWKFSDKKTQIFFHISAQNIDWRNSLEPPRRGCSNEYPQSMFLSRNEK